MCLAYFTATLATYIYILVSGIYKDHWQGKLEMTYLWINYFHLSFFNVMNNTLQEGHVQKLQKCIKCKENAISYQAPLLDRKKLTQLQSYGPVHDPPAI
jgi:hypothetical protein